MPYVDVLLYIFYISRQGYRQNVKMILKAKNSWFHAHVPCMQIVTTICTKMTVIAGMHN